MQGGLLANEAHPLDVNNAQREMTKYNHYISPRDNDAKNVAFLSKQLFSWTEVTFCTFFCLVFQIKLDWCDLM